MRETGQERRGGGKQGRGAERRHGQARQHTHTRGTPALSPRCTRPAQRGGRARATPDAVGPSGPLEHVTSFVIQTNKLYFLCDTDKQTVVVPLNTLPRSSPALRGSTGTRRLPCGGQQGRASAAWRKRAGVPADASVAATLRAT